jgi:hypothetical protein
MWFVLQGASLTRVTIAERGQNSTVEWVEFLLCIRLFPVSNFGRRPTILKASMSLFSPLKQVHDNVLNYAINTCVHIFLVPQRPSNL